MSRRQRSIGQALRILSTIAVPATPFSLNCVQSPRPGTDADGERFRESPGGIERRRRRVRVSPHRTPVRFLAACCLSNGSHPLVASVCPSVQSEMNGELLRESKRAYRDTGERSYYLVSVKAPFIRHISGGVLRADNEHVLRRSTARGVDTLRRPVGWQ